MSIALVFAQSAILLAGGLDLRTEPGVHQARLEGGLRTARLNLTAVVDPLYLTDGEHDLDLVVGWRPSRTHAEWSLTGGWRLASIDLADGHRFHEQLLVGATAELPCLVRGVRAELGLELAITAVRHGAGLGTDWLPADDRVLDVIQPGMYLRIEHAWGL